MTTFKLALATAVTAAALLVAPLAQALTFKIATLSPDGSAWVKVLRQAAAEIERQTAGRVTFKFYPGGVMGDDKTVLRKIHVGQLHGAVITAGGLTQHYTDIQLYNLPMVFGSNEEVDYVRARMDPVLLAGLRANGFVAFGITEVGFAYAMAKKEFSSVADVRTQKVWVPDGDLGSARTLQAFEISPIPLSIADVLAGLQTGLIGGVAVPPVGAIALQWHTHLKHVLDLPLLYVYGLFTLSERQYSKVDQADQKIMSTEFTKAVNTVDADARRDHLRAISALKSQGLNWAPAPAAEVAEWQAYADRASVKMVEDGFVSEDLYVSLLQHLAELRDGAR
ncbi:MAG: TRAP transporter substrate-binding protein DctP [Proteobacteria bacterium]|nr:TRAP transporter substrate-binding protein DctP [Pseudomonadota bacterium]